MNILRGICAAAGLLPALMAGTATQAGPIGYEGMLTLGQTQVYKLPQRSTNWWSFEAEAGDQLEIRVHRLENSFDAAFNLYFGAGSDRALIGFADNDIPQLTGYAGPGSDPRYIFTAATTGTYSIEVFNALPNAGGKDKAFDYQISFASYLAPDAGPSGPLMGAPLPIPGGAHAISEPATIGLLGAGLLGFAMLRRSRRKG